VHDGVLEEATTITLPSWNKAYDDYTETRFSVELHSPSRHVTIHAEVLEAGYYWALMSPAQLCTGFDPGRARAEHIMVCREVACRYTWDGEVSYGLLEISRRL
jgi:hypothetical protein